MVASKAARSVLAAGGKPLIDFGLRRAHGAEAGLLAARASFLAGFAGTATVLAGMAYRIPLHGTMAHSFVQAHEDEIVAFEHFAQTQPTNVILLIDTYDTEAAADKVVSLALTLKTKGITIKGVRLDSGDLADHARKVRRVLDEGGLPHAQIFVSGNLDEYRLRDLIQSRAPIDSFAVVTAMTTSSDAPSLDCAYKLQEYGGRSCRKRSEGKATWPGRKQVWRNYDAQGTMNADVLSLEGDSQAGETLIEPMVCAGKRVARAPTLAEIRTHAARELARLPLPLKRLEPGYEYPTTVSPALKALAAEVDRKAGSPR